MATANSQGIQALLEAEKEAAKVVAKARQYRVQRLRDAKAEAQKEIDALKAQKEKEFQEALKNIQMGDSMTKVDAETSDKVKSVNAAYEKGKEEVLNILVNTVLRVTPQIHQNTR